MPSNYNLALYVNRPSLMHSLDPRSKIIITIIFMLSAVVAISPLQISLLGLIGLTMVVSSRIPLKNYWDGFKGFLIIIIITALIQLFMSEGEVVFSWHFIKVSTEGITLAGLLTLRLILIIIASQVFLMTTSHMALTDGLSKILQPLSRIKFPTGEVVMIMTIAIRFIPLLLEEANIIKRAQMARGADFNSGSIGKRINMQLALLVPLFNIVLQRADELAQAMESRAYSPGEKRSRLNELKMTERDYATIAVMGLVGIITLAW